MVWAKLHAPSLADRVIGHMVGTLNAFGLFARCVCIAWRSASAAHDDGDEARSRSTRLLRVKSSTTVNTRKRRLSPSWSMWSSPVADHHVAASNPT